MNLIFDKQDEVLEVGYKAMQQSPEINKRIFFSLHEFKAACENFEVWGFFDKKPIGMLFFDKNHPHIAITKEYYGKCGKLIKQALDLALKNHKYLVAEVHKDNERAIKFVKRLGFKFKKPENDILIYTVGEEND